MIHEINLPQVPKIIQKKDKPPIIQIDGCYPGYGVTLANALRRVLLSSLPGTAITAFKIKGINHEFSTIPYVIEDVIQIGINLKKVCFSSQKMKFDEPVQATLKKKGKKEIKAGDIKTPADLDIVNKDLHIASLTDKKAELDMELFIASGYGYERTEERQKEKLPIGTIALDAIYSPVLQVSYKVEDMRIGERTDFNRILLEIETDDSLSSADAFKNAASILEKHFNHLAQTKKMEGSAKKPPKAKKAIKKTKKRSGSPQKLKDLGLEEKIINILKKNGVKTIAGLIQRKEDSLKDLKGLGKKSINVIKKKLEKANLSLK